jgi:hypothetical protein
VCARQQDRIGCQMRVRRQEEAGRGAIRHFHGVRPQENPEPYGRTSPRPCGIVKENSATIAERGPILHVGRESVTCHTTVWRTAGAECASVEPLKGARGAPSSHRMCSSPDCVPERGDTGRWVERISAA